LKIDQHDSAAIRTTSAVIPPPKQLGAENFVEIVAWRVNEFDAVRGGIDRQSISGAYRPYRVTVDCDRGACIFPIQQAQFDWLI
jgi:hypothetical protein